VLSKRFRRLFLKRLAAAHDAGRLKFFGQHTPLAEGRAFARYLRPLRKVDWVVYAKPPFAGPEAVLAYLSRYTHRVAISNSRLISVDDNQVSFKWKDYRAKDGDLYKTMALPIPEFIRRFLLHVLPPGFHRIRHYGLLANGGRAENLARARELLAAAPQNAVPGKDNQGEDEPPMPDYPCPSCGGRMVIIEIFDPGRAPRAPPTFPLGIDSI
jgi:hypothetical protein